MNLYIYEPKDWLTITKLLNIKVVDIIKEIGLSRRNFYNSVKKNNTDINLVIAFTDYINLISYNHKKEYQLPAKIKIVNPKYLKKLYKNYFWSYRDIAYMLNISYKTIYFYINNKGYMSYKITKLIGDKLTSKLLLK